jgi:hypothetical protein
MGTQEWILLALVLVVPLLIAVVVTLWTLEQAIKRNKKNRGGKTVRRAAEPVVEPDSPTAAISTSSSADRSTPETPR